MRDLPQIGEATENRYHLFWDENLHDKILTDSQLNYSIERIINVFTLYARVISTRVSETSVQYVELRIVKKRVLSKGIVFYS